MAAPPGNSTDYGCKLSDKGEAAVTLYVTAFTTFATMITNDIFVESFVLAWITWLTFFRGSIGVGIYAFKMHELVGSYIKEIIPGPKDDQQAEAQEALVNSEDGHERDRLLDYRPNRRRNRGFSFHQPPWSSSRDTQVYGTSYVGITTHIIWWFWHTYIPYSQWTWFLTHRHSIYPGEFFARATVVGLMLVAMSFDYKSRVIRHASLKPLGPYIALAMCILSLVARISLLLLMSTELIYTLQRNRDGRGSTNMDVFISIGPFGWHTTGTNGVVVPIYLIFSAFWAAGSFAFAPGRDPSSDGGYRSDFPEIPLLLRPLAIFFFMFFTCCIAFSLYQGADGSNGVGVLEFARCANIWDAVEQLAF